MLGVAVFSPFSNGATFQVSEDSYAVGPLEMNANSGKAGQLEISPQRPAYLRFDVGDFAGQIPSTDVTAARLTFYIAQGKVAGKLGVHRVTSEWAENSSGKRRPPSFSEKPLATLPAASLREGQFAVIDVTEQVKQWLASPDKDFGLALVGDGKAVYVIPSKEGPGKGLSATLEIDHQPRLGDAWISKGVNAAKLGNGSVNNTELATLDGVTAPVQGQLNTLTDNLAWVLAKTHSVATALDHTDYNTDRLSDSFDELQFTILQHESELDYVTDSLKEKVNKAGGTMTGTLRLPGDGLKVGTNQLAVASGKVGIGTDTPTSALEVRGDVKLGAAGNLQAPGAEETLRIVRGTITLQKDGTATLVSGSGFTFSKSGARGLVINFNQPFPSVPTITHSMEMPSSSSTATPLGNSLRSVSTTGAVLDDGFGDYTMTMHFIAIGPR